MWTEEVYEFGLQATLKERWPGSPIQFDATVDGLRDRHSTKTRDKDVARQYAVTYLQERAQRRAGISAKASSHVTLGELFDLFRRRRMPELSKRMHQSYEHTLLLFEDSWGRSFRVLEQIDQHALDTVVKRRKVGGFALGEGETLRWYEEDVNDTTLRLTVVLLNAVFNWCMTQRAGYGWVLDSNPLTRLKIPTRNLNPLQPVANDPRYQEIVKRADEADPAGRFRIIMHLVRMTGRRISEVCLLWASDVVLTNAALRVKLAEEGWDESWADHWPHGAIFWRPENTKRGRGYPVPISAKLAAYLREYMNTLGAIGDVPLLPNARSRSRMITKDRATQMLTKAENFARAQGAMVPRMHGGRWHPFRRLWRSERRHMHDKLVALVGGWWYQDRNSGSLNDGYLQFEPIDMLECASFEPGLNARRRHSRRHTA